MFEAQEEYVIAELLGLSDVQLHRQSTTVTPFDCFVLGYCVSHSNCNWKINLTECSIGDKGIEMLVRGAVEEETHCTGGFSEINLSVNDITTKGVKLYLYYNKNLHSNSRATPAHLIPHMPHLKTIYLSDNPNIGQRGTVPLIKAHNSLEELWLDNTGIGVEDCRALSELLSSSTSLEDLNIASNDLPPEAVKLIISGLHDNTSLKRLNMSQSHFSPLNAISLALALLKNHTLVYLNLRQCNINADGAWQIANALWTNSTLQSLILQNNPIGVRRATAFAELLLKNKSLKKLDLRDDDSIGEEGTQKLIDSLTHNTTVRTLVLPNEYKSSCIEL